MAWVSLIHFWIKIYGIEATSSTKYPEGEADR